MRNSNVSFSKGISEPKKLSALSVAPTILKKDIGELFPDSTNMYKNYPSEKLLQYMIEKIESEKNVTFMKRETLKILNGKHKKRCERENGSNFHEKQLYLKGRERGKKDEKSNKNRIRRTLFLRKKEK